MLFSGLSVRPDAARTSRGAVRSTIVLASLLALAGQASATTLSVTSAKVTRTDGTSAPASIFPVANASAVGAGDRVIMTGSIGPVTRQAWLEAGFGGNSARFIVSGHINDGVAAGDDVLFILRMSIIPSVGSVSWIARATAAAPPSQGFTLTDSGTVFAGNNLVESDMGRTFIFASSMQGDFSFSIDVNWSNAFDPNSTLEVVLHEAQVHLPAPSGGALLLLAAAVRSRRRRRSN